MYIPPAPPRHVPMHTSDTGVEGGVAFTRTWPRGVRPVRSTEHRPTRARPGLFQVKSAVRAVPKFTAEGAPPLLGSFGRRSSAVADRATSTDAAEPDTPTVGSAAVATGDAAPRDAPSAAPRGRPDEADGEMRTRRNRRWLYTGLGSRGLLYHALMAELLVAAIRADDDEVLPAALRRWQQP